MCWQGCRDFRDNAGALAKGKQVALSGLTISNGLAVASSGGGILVDASAVLTVSNSTLSNNSAAYKGGGIYINIYGTVKVINSSQITGNNAPVGSGADVNNQGVLYQDMSSIIGILDGNPAKPI